MEELALAGVEDIPKDLSRDWIHASLKGNLYYGHNHVKIVTMSFDTN